MSSEHKHTKLGEWFATAICGNDILSSALYVSGIAIAFAGIYAPIVLVIVAAVLWFYKHVYTEVVEALPVNGGAYNCLLNGTSKTVAAVAGVMTILSYVATAVISAKVGVEYLNTILPFHEIAFTLPVIGHVSFHAVLLETVLLLFIFAMLVVNGLKDSAKVAFGIFVFHIITLTAVVVVGAYFYFSGGVSHLAENIKATGTILTQRGNMMNMLYLAFSACLLGVSGFESSANFVEEQKKGVFRKTLRNMLIGVAIFNPLIALVCLNAMPFEAIVAAKDFLLADAAKTIGGTVFQYWVVIDAFLVLSGAVLTSFVGVSGLVHRMSLDDCLPVGLAYENNKGTFPRIVVGFFLLCTSILFVTRGELLSLAGVYTIAFLSVMSMFALGNLILKETRTELKRTYNAPILFVGIAFTATFLGILGNIRLDANNLRYFETYFIPSIIVVFSVVYRDYIVRALMRLSIHFPKLRAYLQAHFSDIVQGKFVIFVHHPERVYGMLDYVNKNETGWDITLVHCKSSEYKSEKMFKELNGIIPEMQKYGVFSHFTITTKYYEDEFSPKTIDMVSKDLGVRKNRILIGSIHESHPFDYDELGGVRIIA